MTHFEFELPVNNSLLNAVDNPDCGERLKMAKSKWKGGDGVPLIWLEYVRVCITRGRDDLEQSTIQRER